VIPVEISEKGSGTIGIPIQGMSEVILVIHNLERVNPSPAGYTYSAYNEEGYPFTLRELKIDSSLQGVTLSWKTMKEEDLFGWFIQRATHPEGPYSNLNQMPFPSWGGFEVRSGYVYADRVVEPDQRYYYRLRGVTVHGLSRYSDYVTITTPPNPLEEIEIPPHSSN
jgi:hypothetical protein